MSNTPTGVGHADGVLTVDAADVDRSDDSYAVAVTSYDGHWRVAPLPDTCLDRLGSALSSLSTLSSDNAPFALINVDDDYFVIVRPTADGTRLLISDATAAVSDTLAADILDALHVSPPAVEATEDDTVDLEPWAEGDWSILADLGIPAQALKVLCESDDMWPCEQLTALAADLGFADELAEVTGIDPDDVEG